MDLICACLAGKPCRYNGGAKPDARIAELISSGRRCALFCPECMGGLKIPRPPAEIQNADGVDVLAGRARVVDKDGQDVTEKYIMGANKALALAKKLKADKIWLKAKSPSCGLGQIYDGSFTRTLRTGSGVAAQLFLDNGFELECL